MGENRTIAWLILNDDNAPAHRVWITKEVLVKNPVEFHKNPLHSLGLLSLCDFFLFPKLKNQLWSVCFNNNGEILSAFDSVTGSLTGEDFHNCFCDWSSPMQRCVDAVKEYFGKIN